MQRCYIFQTESSSEIISDEDTILLNPFESKIIPLTIKYSYQRFARSEGFPFPNQKKPVKLNFTILEYPSWCIVSNDKGSYDIPINYFVTRLTYLKVDQIKI